MKPLQLSEDIFSLVDFKDRAVQVVRQLRSSQRPVVLTENGRPAAVLITPEEFDHWRENERFLTAVREGLADIASGRTVSDEEAERLLDVELGRPETA